MLVSWLGESFDKTIHTQSLQGIIKKQAHKTNSHLLRIANEKPYIHIYLMLGTFSIQLNVICTLQHLFKTCNIGCIYVTYQVDTSHENQDPLLWRYKPNVAMNDHVHCVSHTISTIHTRGNTSISLKCFHLDWTTMCRQIITNLISFLYSLTDINDHFKHAISFPLMVRACRFK